MALLVGAKFPNLLFPMGQEVFNPHTPHDGSCHNNSL